jgi:hypothetical protein
MLNLVACGFTGSRLLSASLYVTVVQIKKWFDL